MALPSRRAPVPDIGGSSFERRCRDDCGCRDVAGRKPDPVSSTCTGESVHLHLRGTPATPSALRRSISLGGAWLGRVAKTRVFRTNPTRSKTACFAAPQCLTTCPENYV